MRPSQKTKPKVPIDAASFCGSLILHTTQPAASRMSSETSSVSDMPIRTSAKRTMFDLRNP